MERNNGGRFEAWPMAQFSRKHFRSKARREYATNRRRDEQSNVRGLGGMRMSIIIRLTLFLILAVFSAYVINGAGFVLAHSLAWTVLTFLFSPGILMVFFHGDIDIQLSWTLLVLINICYYEIIYRLIRRKWKPAGG